MNLAYISCPSSLIIIRPAENISARISKSLLENGHLRFDGIWPLLTENGHLTENSHRKTATLFFSVCIKTAPFDGKRPLPECIKTAPFVI